MLLLLLLNVLFVVFAGGILLLVGFSLLVLRQVYRKFAEERELEGCYEGSIEYWAKSLEAARSAGDQNALGQACYRLGKAYTELDDPTRYHMFVSITHPVEKTDTVVEKFE